jgi:ZIP family zinc transporter
MIWGLQLTRSLLSREPASKAHEPSETLSGAQTGSLKEPDDIWLPLWLSLLAGLSTAIGGAIVLLMNEQPSSAAMSGALALAGSVMVYVSIEMTLAHLLQGGPEMWVGMMCISAGALSFVLIQRLLPDPTHTHEADEEAGEERPLVTKEVSVDGVEADKAEHWRLGILMLVVLTAHNFPEGLAVAASAMDSKRMGILVAVAIAAHNIPEGIVIAVPVYAASKSRKTAILWALGSGLTEPLGALVAVAVLRPVLTDAILEGTLCVVAGMMFAVSFIELFPAAWKYRSPAAFAVGVLSGIAIMASTDYVLEHTHSLD